ncbi:MAG TPA: hypothetical protein VIK11_13195 [Tepidiformaceae bacterium]
MAPRTLGTARSFLILLVVLVAGACSSRSDSGPTPTPGPLPASLQQIMNDVSTIRELSPPPTLNVQSVSRSQVPALVKRLLTDDDHRWFARTTTLYRLLGHLRKDQDYESVYLNFSGSDVLGLYSPVGHELWVVHDDGSNFDFDHLASQEMQTLAHEMVHALQDYHFNLDAIDRSVTNDLDTDLTATCVIEGDAVTYAGIYADRFLAAPIASRLTLVSLPAASDAPASLTREFYFPYQDGAAWVEGVQAKHGAAGVDALLQQIPHGTAYVLHPERLDAGWQPASVSLPDLSASLGNGWARESGGTFGEFELRNYLQLHIPGGNAATVAAGWDGDHYDVYVNGSQSVAAFRLHFADTAGANSFLAAQATFLAGAQGKATRQGAITYTQTADGNVTATTAAVGSDVMFVIGSSQAAAQRAMEALVHG